MSASDPARRTVRTAVTKVVVASLEMLSGRSKEESAKEAQAAAEAPDDTAGRWLEFQGVKRW